MSDIKRKEISITEGDHIKLDEAFNFINDMMIKNNLGILRCYPLNLVVTYLGDDDENISNTN